MSRAARRIAATKPYIFQTLHEMKTEAAGRGVDVIDLGVGNPDRRPAPEIVAALHEELDDTRSPSHSYPPYAGLLPFRQAIATWYEQRFGVTVDPNREVLPLVGTKEGLGHLLLAVLDPGDTLLIPTPAYPAYAGAASVAEANVVEVPLREEAGFRIEPDRIPADVARRAKLMIVNYPGNPTGACCDLEHYRQIFEFAREHDILIASDIAYADLVLDEDTPAPSFLEVPGAKDLAVEFYSFSKTYSMAGWRVGFAAGNEELIRLLLKLKSNLDFGVFPAIQRAAARTLLGSRDPIDDLCRTYRGRRDRIVSGLRAAGWNVSSPSASMYIWTRIPEGYPNSLAFVRDLFERTGVLLSPGSGFGDAGEGFVRISLIADEDRLEEVVRRVRESGVCERGTRRVG
jgi:LL-diaminopimelate aminotransferase